MAPGPISAVVLSLYDYPNCSHCAHRAYLQVPLLTHQQGESIGSHLANSYAGYGGFNFTTAGISVDSALKGDARLWMDVCIQYDDVLDFANRAIVADRVKFEAKVKELEVYSSHLIATMKVY